MTRRSTRRAVDRAASTLIVFGVTLGLVIGPALGPSTARADEATADSAKAAAESAKVADQAKADEAKTKSKEQAKKSAKQAKKAKTAKGGSVTEGTKAASGTAPVKPEVEPQHVQVQHILIAFTGSGTRASRPMEEAKKLAYEVLERARKGEDFDALVKQYTDDSPPGIYGMSGIGVAAGAGEHARDKMVPAFGNV